MKTIFSCSCCKKKKAANTSYVSEVNNILTNKRNLIQLESMKLNSQKCTPINDIKIDDNEDNSNNLNNSSQNKQISKSFAFPSIKLRIKSGVSLTSKSKQKNNPNNDKRFLHEFKDKLRCVFCGGKDCRHENYLNNIDNENAIDGLNSNFITDWVIASQRPSEVLIKEFELITQFKEYEIDLIVNLQREGEHPYCGPNAYNLTSAGYSYNPSMFTGDNIKCKLSGWKDMSVPSSMNFMLEIVKGMSHTINDMKKRVLVHCHAGYGRTGVVIACYLLFNSDKNSETVITEIRTKRKKCIESNDQQSFCKKFHDFICHTRKLFDKKETIDVYLKRQEDLLYGNEVSKYGYIPKILTKTFEKIICLKEKYSLENIEIFSLIKGIKVEWDNEYENILDMLKLLLNKNNWDLFDKIENLILIVELLSDWFEDYVHYVISPEKTELIVYSDIFINYQNQIKGNQNAKVKPEIIKELFGLIRKIYHCFEYETLFQFSSFCALITPLNDNDRCVFNSMIERMASGLLGFPFTETNTNQSIEALVVGLSGIIRLIYNAILLEEGDAQMQLIRPLRKNTLILFAKKPSLIQKTIDNQKRSSNNSKLGSVSSPTSPLIKHLKNLINLPGLNSQEKKMINAFEYLSNHFNDKKEMLDKIDFTDNMQVLPLNEIQMNISNDQTVSNFIHKDLDKVIEETLQKRSECISNSNVLSPNNDNDKDKDEDKDKEKDKDEDKEKEKDKNRINKLNSNKIETETASYGNLMKNNLIHKFKPAKAKESNANSLPKPLEGENKKKSSLITFESFRRSLFLSSDSKVISSLASIIKKEADKKLEKPKWMKRVQLPNLPEMTNDQELMKELVLFKERKSQRQMTVKSRNLSQSRVSSERNDEAKSQGNKSEWVKSFNNTVRD